MTFFLAMTLAIFANTALRSSVLSAAQTEEAVSKSLADFPWYDKSTRDFKPLTLPRNEETNVSSNTGDMQAVSFLLRGLMWALIIAALVVLVVLIWRAVGDIPPSDGKESEPKETFRKERLELLPEVVRGITDFLGEAQAKANAGDFSLAMIYYFAWQLLMLDALRAIELDCGKTNRQYLRESSRSKQKAHQVFELSMRHFEDVLYGGIVLEEREFQDVWKHRDQFRVEAKSSSISKQNKPVTRSSDRLAPGGVG